MKIFQLHPTLLCYQHCAWCPYHDIHGDKEIPLVAIQRQLIRYAHPGAILKISGGGSPTLYSAFDILLWLARQLSYTVYLQTENSPLLNSFARNYCHDIRVSFGDGIHFEPPSIPVDGYSYVISGSPDYDNLSALINYAVEHNQYIRVTQDDTDLTNVPTIAEIKAQIQVDLRTTPAGTSEANRLAGLGFNLRFWDALDYHRGKNPCPCYDSPLLTPLGWFPCCKTHVAKGLALGYNQEMILGWEYPTTPYDGSECSRCYY